MMDRRLILIYQESANIGIKMKETVISTGWKPIFCNSLQNITSLLTKNKFQVVILYVTEKNLSIYRYLQQLSESNPLIYTIIVTENPSIQDAVTATKYGAIDYISSDKLTEALPDILQHVATKIQIRNKLNSEKVDEFQRATGIIGKSKLFLDVLQKAQRVAKETISVLLTGESGTGKDILAQAIHYQSPRQKHPFIPVNCGAIPSELMESELFGHIKGSYTGAESTQSGFFHAARGGTLFLDEIGNASRGMQAKLLRAIEDKEVWKVGSRKPDRIDVRIIAATNKSLEELVNNQVFREDLYYRLNVVSLNLPPLRERRNDILTLCQHFVNIYAREHKKSTPHITGDTLGLIQAYDWPGNVRELKNLMQQLIIFLNSNKITVDMLPPKMRSSLNGNSGNNTLTELERNHIQNICIKTNWNITQAAEILGICRRSLYRKLHKHHIGVY